MRRSAVDPACLEAEVVELERLVAAGEMLDVVARLSAMTRASRRLAARAVEPVSAAPYFFTAPPPVRNPRSPRAS